MWSLSKLLKPKEDVAASSKDLRFWEWFVRQEGVLFAFEKDQERIFDELAAQLAKVDRELCFEFGPPEARGAREVREFVISAGGIKGSFPALVSLAKAAPPLDRFYVTAFRPRRLPTNSIECGGFLVSPEEVEVSLLSDGKQAGLHVFLPDSVTEESARTVIGYLLLDEVLGEFDVETRVGTIEMYSATELTGFDRMPLTDLPAAFDRLVVRLEGHGSQPS
jgi:hypothetical protein